MTEDRVKTYLFRKDLAQMVTAARSRPVVVMAHDEPMAVLISHEEYERLKQSMYITTNLRRTRP